MASKIINLGLRVAEFVWTLLIMALAGNMISDSYSGNPSIINYLIFLTVFSFLSLFYLIPATLKENLSLHPLLMVVVDLLNTIFFFCAAVALPAYLHVHSCNNHAYLISNSITNGSANMSKRCREAQANCAFLWFGFASYAASTVLSFVQSRSAGGSRGGNPFMSRA